ncbi:MAG: VTT domain-containing protein [Clostridiales bacterium]|nr:VTT domain-containing protein [Clostridiales bacterium]
MENKKQTPSPGSSTLGSVTGLNKQRRNIFFALQFLFIGTLLVIWISSGLIQKSTNLLVLFFYSFPSEFVIGMLPHEPVLIYFGEFFNPLTVAWVALLSTLLVEASNYFVIRHIFDFRAFQNFRTSKTTGRIMSLFSRAPFLAVWIAGFTPIPFFPFRFLVALAGYPVWKYVLAVAASRGPRFYLLALAGKLMKIPNIVLILFTVILVLTANFPFIKNFARKRLRKKATP